MVPLLEETSDQGANKTATSADVGKGSWAATPDLVKGTTAGREIIRDVKEKLSYVVWLMIRTGRRPWAARW